MRDWAQESASLKQQMSQEQTFASGSFAALF